MGPNQASKPSKGARGKRVTILEDEILCALSLKQYLQQWGYQVQVPPVTALTDIDVLLAAEPDLLFVDINLGYGIDGIEIAKKLVSRRPIPIVLITGYAQKDMQKRTAELPQVKFLEKPLRFSYLHTLLSDLPLTEDSETLSSGS